MHSMVCQIPLTHLYMGCLTVSLWLASLTYSHAYDKIFCEEPIFLVMRLSFVNEDFDTTFYRDPSYSNASSPSRIIFWSNCLCCLLTQTRSMRAMRAMREKEILARVVEIMKNKMGDGGSPYNFTEKIKL